MTRTVVHPILEVLTVRSDGSRTTDRHVFCKYQRRSVDARACYGCAHCDRVTTEPDPAIVCTIPDGPDDLDMVGAVLDRGTVALDPGAPVGDALELLRAADRRSIAVVNEDRALVGVVHEVVFVHPGTKLDDVAAAMSSALAIHESTPIRRALRLLASAHLREATVVDDEGHPLGVFRDIDGLRYIARTRAMISKCDVDSPSE